MIEEHSLGPWGGGDIVFKTSLAGAQHKSAARAHHFFNSEIWISPYSNFRCLTMTGEIYHRTRLWAWRINFQKFPQRRDIFVQSEHTDTFGDWMSEYLGPLARAGAIDAPLFLPAAMAGEASSALASWFVMRWWKSFNARICGTRRSKGFR